MVERGNEELAMRTDGIATGHDVVDVLRAQATRFALPFAIAVCSFVGVVAFYRVCLGRIAYPLELDFIEGVVMDHVIRLAQGQPIYVEPSLSFVPLAYMPLLPALASLLATAFGPELWEPRLVNVVASSATALMVGVTVRAETRRLLLGVAAGRVFVSAGGTAGGAYASAAPDAVMI